MKEYLLERDGKYELHQGGIVPDGAIEVPEGAIKARFYPHDPVGLEFENSYIQWWHDGERTWVDYDDYKQSKSASRIIWSRFTQPEELPFVDDEPMTEDNQIPVDATEIMNKFRAGNIKLDFSQSTGISGLDRPQPDLSDIQLNLTPKHSHYFKDVSDIDEIDVYEVLHRFGVTDPCLQHIIKKALCAGERGHKDFHTDLKNIADTAQRMLEIHGL